MSEVIEILTLKNVLKLFIFVILFGYVLYSLLLSLRVKMLAQTLKTKISAIIQLFGWAHFVVVSVSSLIVGVMILK